MSLFVVVALLIWAGMNGYAFWRLGGLATVLPIHVWWVWIIGLLCVTSFPLSRWLRADWPSLSSVLEVFATTWLGVLLLLCVCFMVVDSVTLGGFVLRAWVVRLRWAALIIASILSLIALVQGAKNPVVSSEEVMLPGLPRERDGVRLVFVSDLHLGDKIDETWVSELVQQITNLKPDLIAIGGDVVDHDTKRVQAMIPALRGLHAPLGVWAVLGNHDYYSGEVESSRIMQEAGFRVLHDESAIVVPGLRMAGVDDLGFRGRSSSVEPVVRKTLSQLQRGKEGCVYLSHTPVEMTTAASAGAGLMLCGHTHGGQLWPFNYLVAMHFPTIAGRYSFGDMTLIVSRGAGTWGPRMRLWKPGEIVLVTLRSP